MAKYQLDFIEQNTLPKGPKYMYLHDSDGHVVGRISAPGITLPEMGPKLYSFGALADVHVTHSTLTMQKFQKALAYFNDVEKVLFTCIAGDLISGGTAEQFARYKAAKEEYSPNTEVHDCMGNHDVESTTTAPFLTLESTRPFIGHDLYYSFTQGDDVFIMFGMSGWPGKTGNIFTTEAVNWLYQTLEANRDKRCFVFEHCPHFRSTNGIVTEGGSGAVIGWPPPTGNLLSLSNTDTGASFRALMAHYHNVIWFHGHSHMEFQYQADCSHVNYDNSFGCHSIHIPSLAEGREVNAEGTGFIFTTPESSGYVVDVYQNHIVLRGRDFVADKFVPIATFCLDTTPKVIEPRTFTDPAKNIAT